jgi:pimeloyl-ACP methyl ester carboxylesterase
MKHAICDAIATRYQVVGEGPPLLMFSPGGFDATIEKWSTLGIYAKVKPVETLRKHFSCILFDRRECGESGGRVERVTWGHYVAQARALLAHLQIEKAHLMGGCMGCGPAAAFAAAYPEMVLRMVLYWPVGGARYRLNGQMRFAEHLGYVTRHGLAAVVALVQESGKAFGADPRGGPWACVIKQDAKFAADYAAMDLERYKLIVAGMARLLLDRDTAPGAEPEDLMRSDIAALIVPGNDAAHATSAARYLQECLPRAEYWDAPVEAQSEAETSRRLLDFLLG